MNCRQVVGTIVTLQLLVFVPIICSCSGNNQVGTPGRPGRGGAATTNVAGLNIEAEPTGSDGGSVSVDGGSDGPWNVRICGVRLIVSRQADGMLDVQIDGQKYGSFNKGDHLLIDHNRDVFLNGDPIVAETSGASKRDDK